MGNGTSIKKHGNKFIQEIQPKLTIKKGLLSRSKGLANYYKSITMLTTNHLTKINQTKKNKISQHYFLS